jgi:hypothetical protein
MGISNRAHYLYTISDVPGVVTANNFLSVMNPAGSGVTHIALMSTVSSYATGATSVPKSMVVWRITSHVAGVPISGALIARHQTNWPDPVTQVRVGNPVTVPTTAAGPLITSFPPVIATGPGVSNSIATSPAYATLVALPGEGFAFGTAAGDVDQVWSITYIWQEVS